MAAVTFQKKAEGGKYKILDSVRTQRFNEDIMEWEDMTEDEEVRAKDARLRRESEFDASHRRHTRFASRCLTGDSPTRLGVLAPPGFNPGRGPRGSVCPHGLQRRGPPSAVASAVVASGGQRRLLIAPVSLGRATVDGSGD